MPTATDLVTDLPADFEVFGQAVATSMADLLGGTSGQILSKTTNADMDFTWTTPNPGDITGVTAGVGISGGGTSGNVTVTNSMATEITAKGDLIAGTGSATFDNLPVGTNGQTLVADSTASTGLKWATPASAGFVGAVVFNTTEQSIADNTSTTVAFNSERVDTNSFHDNATNNSRITIPVGYAGKYYIWCNLEYAANSTGTRKVNLLINGSYPGATSINKIQNASSAGESQNEFFFFRDLVVSDFVTLQVRQTSGGNLDLGGSVSGYTIQFGVQYLGA